MTITTPLRRSSQIRLLYRRFRWTSVQSKAQKQPIRQLTTTLFIQTRSQGGSFSYHQTLHDHHACWEETLDLENPFQKTWECRSTSAKPVDRLSLQKRTFPHPLQTKIKVTNKKLYLVIINSTYLMYLIRSSYVICHFEHFSCNWYVSST